MCKTGKQASDCERTVASVTKDSVQDDCEVGSSQGACTMDPAASEAKRMVPCHSCNSMSLTVKTFWNTLSLVMRQEFTKAPRSETRKRGVKEFRVHTNQEIQDLVLLWHNDDVCVLGYEKACCWSISWNFLDAAGRFPGCCWSISWNFLDVAGQFPGCCWLIT